MARAGLKHWMLHNDQLAHELDETLKLSPGYDPVRDVDPALTFHAPLLTGPDSIPGAIRAIVERNSEGTYRAPRGAFLLSAPDDESRHEYTSDDEPLGVLMEQATTNKCENYNADADDALTNMRVVDIADGVLSALEDEESLHRSGLSALVGKVFFLDNRGNPQNSFVQAFGECGNLNPHSAQVQMHVLQGRCGLGIRFDQSDFTPVDEGIRYEHITLSDVTPDSVNNRISIRANPDSACFFILNQLEEEPDPTSVIVTEGAATSRALDRVRWPLTSILNQAEGMAAVRVTFGWSFDDTVAGQQQSFITFLAGEVSLLYHNNSSGTSWLVSRDDAATFAEVQFPPGKPEKDEHYLLMVRWGNGTFQVGFKIAGAVTWGVAQPYVGRFDEEGEMHFSYITKLPLHGRDLHVWSEDRGTAWLESFFEGVAN